MANKWQVIHSFMASFSLPAYEEASIPTGELAPDFPYLSYSLETGYALDESTIQFSLWYRSPSQAEINLKTDEIAQDLGLFKVLPCDEGAVIIRPGTPFAQGMQDPHDPLIKRKLITLEASYITIH